MRLNVQCFSILILVVVGINQEYDVYMKFRKAYRFRVKPAPEQLLKLEQFAGCCRFIWNKTLKMSLDRLNNKQYIVWYHEADFWVKLWKSSEEYGFLGDCHSQILQQKLKDLNRAFKDGFDKKQPLKRIPKFRKKGIHDSFRYPQGFKIDNKRIYLPKIGWVGFFKSQDILGTPKNITISRRGKHWYCSIQVEIEMEQPKTTATSSIGIDMGINKFVAMSNGEYVNPANMFRKLESLLAKEQRKLSKKKKFSNNFNKQKKRIQHIHSKIANSRLDFLHKLSTTLSNNHALIVVEALKIKNMSKSAKGNVDKHGRNVKAKSGLNKSILDQGWGIFRTQLKYKLEWSGGIYLEVPPKHTSQKCNKCTHTCSENRKTQESFQCIKCGYEANADLNAAKNVLVAGHAMLACGEGALATSVKQELLQTSDLVAA